VVNFVLFLFLKIGEEFPSYLDTIVVDDDSTTSGETNSPIELGNEIDWFAFLAPPSSSPPPQMSTQVVEQSEANENVGMDTSTFSDYGEISLLSPSLKVASSIVDDFDYGKLIEFDPQAFESTLEHFRKAEINNKQNTQ
jgi:hypothetical protein